MRFACGHNASLKSESVLFFKKVAGEFYNERGVVIGFCFEQGTITRIAFVSDLYQSFVADFALFPRMAFCLSGQRAAGGPHVGTSWMHIERQKCNEMFLSPAIVTLLV